jgi:hypothetical protein
MKISIAWKDLELDEAGSYNESLLADIRKQLRASAEGAELEMRIDGESDLQDRFLNAAAHCCRRLKNCGIGKWTLFCPGEVPVPEAFTSRLAERLRPYFP